MVASVLRHAIFEGVLVVAAWVEAIPIPPVRLDVVEDDLAILPRPFTCAECRVDIVLLGRVLEGGAPGQRDGEDCPKRDSPHVYSPPWPSIQRRVQISALRSACCGVSL